MRFCEFPGGCKYDLPVWGTDKNTRIGYCKNHQAARTDISKKSIQQRAIEKHKEEKKTKPGFFVMPESEEVVSTIPKEFTPPKWMQDEANDIVKPYKSFNPDTPMGQWFLSQRPKMTGVCMHCGGKTMAIDKESDTKFHWSLGHLFDKAHFPSIATHEENCLELCYYSPSCHTNYDNKILPITQLNCFDEVVRKACILYPLLTTDEKRRFPKVLLPYIEIER